MTVLAKKNIGPPSHVVDVFGNIKGRDQPIMRLDKAVYLVNQLDSDVFTNDEHVFFDPFCKSGEILLASALVSLQNKSEQKLVDLSTNIVHREMFKSNRYFGMAPDERHYRLSLRTFYGNEKSHDPDFTQNIKNGNYLSELDGKLNKDKFNKELQIMIDYIKDKAKGKKIIAVGNPPYQEEDKGYGKSAKPIYNIFIESLIDSKKIDQFCLVVPSRWFSGGKGLDSFRENMIKCKKIQKINYFEDASFIFPSVDIRGGVCFLHWNKKHNSYTSLDNKGKCIKKDFSKYGIIIPHIQAYSIIDKIIKNSEEFISKHVWARKPFGLSTNHKFSSKINYHLSKQMIECISRGKRVNKIQKEIIITNNNKIQEYQVVFPKASGGGKGHRDKVLLKPEHFFILEKGQVSTETYSVAHSFKDKNEAEKFLAYMRTSFVRFLLGLRKPTQDTKKDTFAWVPLMPLNKAWTDKKLFEYFKLTEEEQKYITKQVEKWTA